MTITGTVYATPSWSVNSNNATAVTYTFNTILSSTTVTSQSATIAIVNPSILGSDSLTLTLPTSCTIGGQSVGANNIVFVENGNTHSVNGLISGLASWVTTSGVSTSLQFTNVTKTGTVACSGGSFAYAF